MGMVMISISLREGRRAAPPSENSQVLACLELRLHRARRRFRRRAGADCRLLFGAAGGRALHRFLRDGLIGGLFFVGHGDSFLQINLIPTRRLTTEPAARAAASSA